MCFIVLLAALLTIVLFYISQTSSSQKIDYTGIAYLIHVSKETIENNSAQTVELSNFSDTNVVEYKTIYYRQSGGFAGTDIDIIVDVDSLTKDEAVQVQHIIDEIGFFKLDPIMSESIQQGHADYYNFTVTVEDKKGVKHTVYKLAPNPGSTDELEPLISWICEYKKCQ